jgi:membrane associated rhomboid family serine protease
MLRDSDAAYRVPALSLSASLRDIRVLAFLFVWFGANLLFGIGSLGLSMSEQPIAWQAHIGGFLAGLVGFALFDPVPHSAPVDDDSGSGPDPSPTVH